MAKITMTPRSRCHLTLIETEQQAVRLNIAILPTGPKGADGDSTYQLAVKNGYIGTEQEWLDEIQDGVSIKDLISTDSNNDLRLGSDNKLLSRPQDVDFLAYFILAKG